MANDQADTAIRVLIVEDSAFMRKTLREILLSDPGITVAGIARNGEEGVARARELRPDVITMDVDLPKMDGLTAMQIVLDEKICPVIVVSAFTGSDSVTTFEALELGAFDCILKPSGTDKDRIGKSRNEIVRMVKAAAGESTMRKITARLEWTRGPGRITSTGLTRTRARSPGSEEAPQTAEVRGETGRQVKPARSEPPEIAVVIGLSTGGPGLLLEIMERLPTALGAAVFLVQHMPETFTASFARRLDRTARFPVFEAAPGMPVFTDRAYLGRGGRHMTVHRRHDGSLILRLSPYPESLFRPSVDVTMESVVSVFGCSTVGVLLTGMGDDGAEGLGRIREAGGLTFAESEETAVVYGMPKAAVERGAAMEVLPAYRVPDAIVSAVRELQIRILKERET